MSEKTPQVVIQSVNEKDRPRRHSQQPRSSVSSISVRRNNSIEKSSLVPPEKLDVRRSNSLDKSPKRMQIKARPPSVPDIPEVDQSEDEPPKTDNHLAVPKKYSRQSSVTSKTSKSSRFGAERGFVNEGYDQSNGSSLHGSMASLS